MRNNFKSLQTVDLVRIYWPGSIITIGRSPVGCLACCTTTATSSNGWRCGGGLDSPVALLLGNLPCATDPLLRRASSHHCAAACSLRFRATTLARDTDGLHSTLPRQPLALGRIVERAGIHPRTTANHHEPPDRWTGIQRHRLGLLRRHSRPVRTGISIQAFMISSRPQLKLIWRACPSIGKFR